MQAVRGGCGGTQGAGGTPPYPQPPGRKDLEEAREQKPAEPGKEMPSCTTTDSPGTYSERLLGPALCQALGG